MYRVLAYLRNTNYDRSVVHAPPRSMPGLSGDGTPPPPKEENVYDLEVERVEGLLRRCA